MSNNRNGRNSDARPWAPPRVGVPVERRDSWEIAMHGARAGLLAGLTLGAVQIAASTMLSSDPWLPFDFAAALVVGPATLLPAFPIAASLALGGALHVLLSIVFGVAFLGGLALAYQLSARPLLVFLYGTLFGAVVWEVSFLAVLPAVAPELTGRLEPMQLWGGILSYCLVYGPALAAYVVRVRPGMLDQWWRTDLETS